jgi:LysR family transcriptional activator of nhaA
VLNYNHLHHFWTVAAEGSLSRAAARLGLTHSTLSSQLRRLEQDCGHTLFVRKSRGVALTPFGEQLKQRCDDIFRAGAALAEALQDGRLAARAAVHVGAVPSLPRTLLLRALQNIVAGDDAPPFTFTTGPADALVEKLVAGRLHVVLADRPPLTSVDARVYAHLLGEHAVQWFASPRLARRLRGGFPRSLDGAPVLLPPFGSALRDALLHWLADAEVRPRVVGEIDDVPLLKTFAAHGRGVVAVREPLADEARRRYGLRFVGPVTGVRATVYLMTPERRIRHPDVQRLVAACRRALQAR